MNRRATLLSLGRAIRHKDDYSSILLIDARYHHANIRERLPPWIIKSLMQDPQRFGTGYSALVQFFKRKRHDNPTTH